MGNNWRKRRLWKVALCAMKPGRITGGEFTRAQFTGGGGGGGENLTRGEFTRGRQFTGGNLARWEFTGGQFTGGDLIGGNSPGGIDQGGGDFPSSLENNISVQKHPPELL